MAPKNARARIIQPPPFGYTRSERSKQTLSRKFHIYPYFRFTLPNSHLLIPTMGRTSDAKERLLDAMVELMWERSYGSLTIDIICEQAGVKKGSFYYFFKSKLELGIAAVDHIWAAIQPKLDTRYSPSRPSLEALSEHMHHTFHKASESQKEHGRVLGCPFFNLGAEISTIEPELAEKVNCMLNRYQRYIESAVNQALSDGSISDVDSKKAGRIIFNLCEGMLTQARIKNDPEVLKDLPPAVASILGLKELPSVTFAT